MQDCFLSGDVQKLVDLQKSMDPKIFNPNMVRCMKAGLWSQPMGDDSEEEGRAGAADPVGGEDGEPLADDLLAEETEPPVQLGNDEAN